jgi:hypothetical protein
LNAGLGCTTGWIDTAEYDTIPLIDGYLYGPVP